MVQWKMGVPVQDWHTWNWGTYLSSMILGERVATLFVGGKIGCHPGIQKSRAEAPEILSMKLPGPAAVWQSDFCLVSGFRIPKNPRSWLHLSFFWSQFFLCKSEVIKDSHLGIFGYRSPCIPSVLVIISETTVQKRLCGQNTDALEALKHYI